MISRLVRTLRSSSFSFAFFAFALFTLQHLMDFHRALHEQEQAADDRPGESRTRGVVDVGDHEQPRALRSGDDALELTDAVVILGSDDFVGVDTFDAIRAAVDGGARA